MSTFYIKTGDLLPLIRAQLTGAGGRPQKLDGAAVEFHMRDAAGTLVVNANATVENAARGVVSYAWVTADTDTAGTYSAEFEVSVAGKAMTFPNDSNITVVIADEVA
jgi:uncharacterized protein YfaS (alpha-2-macroglobulin family)